MGERTDSERYQVKNDAVSNGSAPTDVLKMAKDLDSQKRLKDIRSGVFKGEGKFSCIYVGGVVPKKDSGDSSLDHERGQNCLALQKKEKDTVVSDNLEESKSRVPEVSTAAITPATPRLSYMKRTISLQDLLLEAL